MIAQDESAMSSKLAITPRERALIRTPIASALAIVAALSARGGSSRLMKPSSRQRASEQGKKGGAEVEEGEEGADPAG